MKNREAEIKSLLVSRRLGIARLKRHLAKINFHLDRQDQAQHWVRLLSAMDYVRGIAERFAPDAPLLPLYKFVGEKMNADGTIRITYAALQSAARTALSFAFAARSRVPFPFEQPGAAVAALVVAVKAVPAPQTTLAATANADHSIEYIQSLLGPVTAAHADEMVDSLRALAGHAAEVSGTELLLAPAITESLRRFFLRRIELVHGSPADCATSVTAGTATVCLRACGYCSRVQLQQPQCAGV